MLLVICSGVLVTGDVPAAAWTVFLFFFSLSVQFGDELASLGKVLWIHHRVCQLAPPICSVREALILLVRSISDWSEMDDVTTPSQHQATALASPVDSLSHE